MLCIIWLLFVLMCFHYPCHPQYKQTDKHTNIYMDVHCTARKRGGDRDGTKSIMIMLVININICGQIHGRRMKRTRRFSQWDKLFLVEVLAYSNASMNNTRFRNNSLSNASWFSILYLQYVYYTSTLTHTHMHTRTKFSGFNTHVGCHLYTICFCFRLVCEFAMKLLKWLKMTENMASQQELAILQQN